MKNFLQQLDQDIGADLIHHTDPDTDPLPVQYPKWIVEEWDRKPEDAEHQYYTRYNDHTYWASIALNGDWCEISLFESISESTEDITMENTDLLEERFSTRPHFRNLLVDYGRLLFTKLPELLTELIL